MNAKLKGAIIKPKPKVFISPFWFLILADISFRSAVADKKKIKQYNINPVNCQQLNSPELD